MIHSNNRYSEFQTICKSISKTQIMYPIDTFSVVLDGSLETIEKSFGSFLLWREMEKQNKNPSRDKHIGTIYAIGRMATLLALSYKLDVLETFFNYMWYVKCFHHCRKDTYKECESSKIKLEGVLREGLREKRQNKNENKHDNGSSESGSGSISSSISGSKSYKLSQMANEWFVSDIIAPTTYYTCKQKLCSVEDVIRYCIPRSSDEINSFYQISLCDWYGNCKLKKTNPNRTFLLGSLYESFQWREWLEKKGFISYIHSPPKRDLNIWNGIHDALYSNLSLSNEYIPKWRRMHSSIKIERELTYTSYFFIRIYLYIRCILHVFSTKSFSMSNSSKSSCSTISCTILNSHFQHIYEWWIDVLSIHLPKSSSLEVSLC